MSKKCRLTPLRGLVMVGATTLVTFVSLTGCIDERYDLSGDKLNKEITLGGDGLAIPIGTSPKYTIENLFGDAKYLLVVDQNGVYSVGETGEISTTFELDSYNKQFDISFKKIPALSVPINLPEEIEKAPSTTIIPSVTLNIPLTKVLLQERMPFAKDIKSIAAIEIAPLNGTLALTLALNETLRKKCKIQNLIVTFPNFIETGLPNNQMRITYDFSSGATCNITFPIKGVKEFTWYQTNLEIGIEVADNLAISGQLIVANATAGELKSISDVKFTPTISIPEIKVKSITGIFANEIEAMDKVIDLSDIPDFLEGATLGLENCILKIEIDNPTMTPFATTIMNINGVNIGELPICKSIDENTPMKSKFWISAQAPSEKEQGDYTFHHVPNITTIFDPIPSQPKLNIQAKIVVVDDGVNDKVKMEPYAIPFKYEVLIPLNLSEDFCISDVVKIESLGTILSDIKQMNANTKLTATFTNSIPLNLEARLIPKDNNNNPVAGISIGESNRPIIVKGATSSTEATTSVAEVSITENEPNALERVYSIDVQLIIGGLPNQRSVMRAGQWINIKLGAKLPGGITTTL